MRRFACVGGSLAVVLVAAAVHAQKPDGAALYDAACAACHDTPAAGSRAPSKEALRDRSPEAVVDAKTGCVVWTFTADGGVRASVSIGARGSSTYGAYFSDQKGYAYAVDAATGALVWRRRVEDHPLVRLTGSPALHDGRLYVPTSS